MPPKNPSPAPSGNVRPLPKQPLSVDGFARRQALNAGATPGRSRTNGQPQNATGAKKTSTPRAFQQPKTPPKSPKKVWKQLQIPLILLGGFVGGFLVQTPWVGIALAGIYSVIALFGKIPSRITFSLAAVAVGAVCVLFLFKPNRELASIFTTYTFILLATGVLCMIRESHEEQRRFKKKSRKSRSRH